VVDSPVSSAASAGRGNAASLDVDMVDPKEGPGPDLAPFRVEAQPDTVTVTINRDVPVWYPGPGCSQYVQTKALGTPEALCRTRTDDPFLTMEVLYQLS
jgi:hypothetical protein